MKPILLYLVLVGLPLLGIWELLRVGQTLSAPTSLAGKWSAQLSPPNQRDSLQGDPLLRSGPVAFSISQSGPNLVLSFDDNQTTLIGSVQDTTVNAAFLCQGATATSLGTAIYFHATVDRQTEPDRLLGLLIFAHGPLRTEMPLTATRQSGVRKAIGAP